MLLLSAVLLAAMQTASAPPINVSVSGRPRACKFDVEGRRVSGPEFIALLRGLEHERELQIVAGTRSTSVHCISEAMFLAQSAGIVRVGFIAEADPAQGKPR